MPNLTLITMKIGKIPLVILIIFMYLEIFAFLQVFLTLSLFFSDLEPLSFLKKINFWVDNSAESSNVLTKIMSTLPEIYLKYYWILLVVFNGYFCVLYFHNKDMLFKYIKTLKFCLIPYWIFCFILQTPILIFLTITGIILPVFIFIFNFTTVPFLILVSYITLLFTSVPSILYLFYLEKNNLIKKQSFIINLIFQFCYFTDIVSTIYLIKMHDRNKYINNVI